MKAIINRHMFAQGNVDSGSITMMSTIVHKLAEPGEHRGSVIKGRNVIGHFTIIVGKKETPGLPTQVQIDLRQAEAPTAQAGMVANRFSVGADGYAVFKVSAGAGGYAVELYREGAKVFDSCELQGDDLLYVMVLRPGTYSLQNAITNARAELTVAYPEKGMARNAEPVRIECGKSAISPDKISVKPMQGMVFSFKAPSRIKIDLVRPEDRAPVTNLKGAAQQMQPRSKAAGKKIRRRISIMPRSAP